MLRPILASAIAACLAVAPVTATAQQKPRTACELLSAVEVAKFLGAPAVQLDSTNSGKNELTGVEFCTWFVSQKDPRGLIVKLRRGESAEDAPLLLSSARVEDEFGERHPVSVAGVGDEAQYADWPDKSGGTFIVRSGRSVVTFHGSVTKASGVAMAKVALPRL